MSDDTNLMDAVTWLGESGAAWARHYGGRAAGDPAVTLIRLNGEAAAPTYAAVHAADALAVVGDWIADHGADADTVPWTALPGIEGLAAADLRCRPRRSVSILGTAVDGQWTSWHLPTAAPPVPAT